MILLKKHLGEHIMNILVFSDSHGYYERILKIINANKNIDMIIHCGDILSDCYNIEKLIDANIQFHYVCGNNDINPLVPKELSFVVDNKKIFVTHGHLFGVKSGCDTLRKKIKEGYDLVLYGHTHIPDTEYFGGGTILNPGAMCYSSKGTYAIVSIENDVIKTQIQRI